MLLNFFGFVIECRSESADLALSVVRPFSYFIAKDTGPAAETIIINEKSPPYKDFPVIPASFSSPRNIVYTAPDIKIIDYFGKGVVVHEYRHSRYTIYGKSRNFIMETFYLLVLSLFGQHCDASKMMRIHALALSYKDTAFLMPIPPGGGKSTMAINLLKDKSIRLISDDEPVYDSTGSLRPFPLRIGTLDKQVIDSIPREYIYPIERMEFGLKYFIDCAYWDDQIEKRHLTHMVIFSARRVLNGKAAITPIPRRRIFKSILRDAVVGIGLYQGVEFLFSHSNLEILSKFKLLMNRLKLAVKLVRSAHTYQFDLSGDIQNNVEVLRDFIKNFKRN